MALGAEDVRLVFSPFHLLFVKTLHTIWSVLSQTHDGKATSTMFLAKHPLLSTRHK